MRKNSLSDPGAGEQRQVLELGLREWRIRKALEEYRRGPYFCAWERPRSCWERRLPAGPGGRSPPEDAKRPCVGCAHEPAGSRRSGEPSTKRTVAFIDGQNL